MTIPSLVVSAVGVTAGLQITNFNSIAGMGPNYATGAATNGPVAAHTYNGHAYGQDLNNLVIEVRDLSAYSATVPSSIAPFPSSAPPPVFFNPGDLARDTADNTIWAATVSQIVNNTTGMSFATFRATVPGTWSLVNASAIKYTRARIAGVWGTWIQL